LEPVKAVSAPSPMYMLGTVLAKTDDLAGAQQAWRDGIEAAGRTGAWKAGQHMQALLAGVGANEPLCPD